MAFGSTGSCGPKYRDRYSSGMAVGLRVVLVGNKADLSQDRKVTTEEARQWARENDVSVCVESSAKSGDGVEEAFQRVAEEVFRKIRDGVFDLTDKVPVSAVMGC